ncbi:Low-density lipoprotein receptor-related protein 2 [Thelohanellus kitauei]|uniref:Low-density lipoprotein receptor-related protein 2 n=1 Tax=Thelohanellus kitauei TaxID=669202 RepID=A0A0C2N6D6_THEKT|nr:Low-density lipoprotein receptor-related protein 2 [Thelohanellus kitauei]
MVPSMFSSDLQLNETILNFMFDKFQKCLYYHAKNGIIRKCFKNKQEILKPHVLIIRDTTIMGIDLDPLNGYLFYFNKHTITLVNLRMLVRTTIYRTYNYLQFLKLDVLGQKIIISYLEKEKRRTKIRIIYYSTTVEDAAFDFDTEFQEISIDDLIVKLFTSEGIYEYILEHNEQSDHRKKFIKSTINTISGIKPNEYYCQNHQCILLKYVCNGIDDCNDGSDELRCSTICNQNETRCHVDDKCINDFLICNGENDCSDGSDEFDCDRCFQYTDLEKRCEDFGAICDDGTCLKRDQVCDGVFHCFDFSDERACNIRIFYDKDISCLISCDERCVPVDKICDHLTDCRDGSDEQLCGFRTICPIKKPIPCDDGDGCYGRYDRCNGFKDCSDGSDEKDCRRNIPCFGNEEFLCSSDSKICMSHVCDGVSDCDDDSDENTLCGTHNHLQDVDVTLKDGGLVLFSWIDNHSVLPRIVEIHSMLLIIYL